MKMTASGQSVLPIFGENLESLCVLGSSVAQVARDLDISRMQMRRYMNGESFPKPNQLQRICDYFGVDARILTERLSDSQLSEIAHFGHLSCYCERNSAIKEAIDYVEDFAPFFNSGEELTDGLYLYLTLSQLQTGMLAQTLMQVRTLHRGRVVRSTLPLQYSDCITGKDDTRPAPGRRREIRGIVLRQTDGYCLHFFNSHPRRVSSMIFLTPALNADRVTFEGLYMIAQAERKGLPRVSRCMLQRIEPTARNILRAAHRPTYIPIDEAPADLRKALTRPVE